MREITEILSAFSSGKKISTNELFDAVYAELHEMASAKMRFENPANTLQATALVHEAFIRLQKNQSLDWQSRGHFFGAASEAMRRILIDSARSRGRIKRGGQASRVDFDSATLGLSDDEGIAQLLDLDNSLEKLELEDEQLALIVKLRFFAGRSMQEIAQILDVSLSSVERRWRFARAWLSDQMNQ